MRREFVINIIILVVANILIKPLYIFGIETQVQNSVGIENYGIYFDYFNFIFLLQIFHNPGIQNWNAQLVPKLKAGHTQHLSILLQSKVLLSFAFIPLAFALSFLFDYSNYTLLFSLCVLSIVNSVFLLLRGIVAGIGRYRIDSILSIIDKFLLIFGLGIILWTDIFIIDFTIQDFVTIQIIVNIICCILTYVVIRNLDSYSFSIINTKQLWYVVKSSLPFAMTLFLMTAYNRLDGVMLGRILDDNNYAAGVYATAYRFYDAANMLGFLFASLLLPMFAANLHSPKIIKELQTIGLSLTVISSSIIILVIFYYGNGIMAYLYDEYTPAFYNTLLWMMYSYFFVSVAYIFGTLAVSTGKIHLLNWVFFGGVIINFVLNFLLIPSMKAEGAAITTFITQIFVSIGQIWLIKNLINIMPDRNNVIKLAYFIALSILAFYVSSLIFNDNQWIACIFSILFCLLLPFILKIIEYKEVFSLLSKK